MKGLSIMLSTLLLAVTAAIAHGQTQSSLAMLADAAYTLSDGASTAKDAARLYRDLAATATAGEPVKNDFSPYGSPDPGEWHGFVADVTAVGEELSQLTRDVGELRAYRDAPPLERYLSREKYRRTSQQIKSLKAVWVEYEKAVKNANRWIERMNEREWMREGCSACAPPVPAREISKRNRTERSLARRLTGGLDTRTGRLASTADTLSRVAGELAALEAEVAALEPNGGAHLRAIGAKQMGSMIGMGGFTVPPPAGAQQ